MKVMAWMSYHKNERYQNIILKCPKKEENYFLIKENVDEIETNKVERKRELKPTFLFLFLF